MELASGYSDGINYGNGYTPLATGAINNNNADYARNQAAIALMAQQAMNQHNAAIQAQGPSSGYGTVGGYPSFGEPSGPGSIQQQQPQQPQEDLVARYWELMGGGGGGGGRGGIGSDAARAPNQPEIPASFNDRFSTATQYQPYGPGYFDNTFGSVNQQQRDLYSQRLDGQTKNDYFNGLTGGGSGAAGTPFDARFGGSSGGAETPTQTYYRLMGMSGGGGGGGGGGMMASGGDTSWLGAGGPSNDYNPFGQINSGQVGQFDPFMGYQPQPTFDQRFGNLSQPYGPGYFDNTFGSVSQNGPGSFNSRFPATNTPGMISSDQSEAARQQAIQDLMRTLGTTVAPAYDPHVAPDVPSTLVPSDYQQGWREGR